MICFKCNKKGHFARNCRSKKKYTPGGNSEREAPRQKKTTNWVGDQESSGEEATVQTVYMVESGLEEPMKIKLLVNGEPLQLEIDTGAVVSIIPHRIWKKHFFTVPLEMSHVTLCTYTAEPMKVMGTFSVPVVYQKQTRKRFFVVRTNGPSLLGREGMRQLHLDWSIVKYVGGMEKAPKRRLEEMLQKLSEVFGEKLGTISGFISSVWLKSGVAPKFCKPRPVPFAIKQRIGDELDKLEKDGNLVRVMYCV